MNNMANIKTKLNSQKKKKNINDSNKNFEK